MYRLCAYNKTIKGEMMQGFIQDFEVEGGETGWDKLSKQHILATTITILNFKISGGNSGWGGGGDSRAPTPLYETL